MLMNRFLVDALDRFAEEMQEEMSSSDILFKLKLRNGKPLHKSRYIRGADSRRQAQSLHFALKKHPMYYISTHRRHSGCPAKWSVKNEE